MHNIPLSYSRDYIFLNLRNRRRVGVGSRLNTVDAQQKNVQPHRQEITSSNVDDSTATIAGSPRLIGTALQVGGLVLLCLIANSKCL